MHAALFIILSIHREKIVLCIQKPESILDYCSFFPNLLRGYVLCSTVTFLNLSACLLSEIDTTDFVNLCVLTSLGTSGILMTAAAILGV